MSEAKTQPLSFGQRIKRRGRRGSVVVELACVAPFMILVTLAFFEFARLEFLKGMAQVATYDAARYIMVPGAVKQEGMTLATNKLSLCGAKNATVEVHAYDQNGEQTEITDSTSAVMVRVEIPMQNNLFSLGRFVRDHRLIAQTRLTSETYDSEFDNLP